MREEHESYLGFTSDQERRFWNLNDGIRRYGYYVAADPIDGMQERFLESLKEGFEQIEKCAEELQRLYGYRGVSKKLKAHLHQTLKEPCFNIKIDELAK